MKGTNNDLVITTSFDAATETDVPLLHFPVQICKATGSVDVKYDGAAPSGAEYETQYVDKATGEVFDYAERQRGVRVGDQFKPIPEEQIEAIEEATKLVDMRVERAVPYEDIPFERATGLYYLQVPAKSGAHKVYNLIYRALLPQKGKTKADKQRLALRVKFTARSRQKLGVVYADAEKGCLVLNTLTFAAEVREPDEAVLAHQVAQVEQPQVEKARKVVLTLMEVDAGDWDAPIDAAIDRKRELVEQAAAGEAIEVPVTATADAVQSDKVADVLEASLAAAK
jgi:non-homologous end joining protein Ku